MPYIKEEDRAKFNYHVDGLIIDLTAQYALTGKASGDLNYCISRVVNALFERNKCYQTANDILGVLTAVQLEFYRRKVAPYEDTKIKENGDI